MPRPQSGRSGVWYAVALPLLTFSSGKSAVISGADNEVESAASVTNETCTGTDVACIRTKLPTDDDTDRPTDLTTKSLPQSQPL